VLKDKQIFVQRKKRLESRPIDKINKSNEHSIDERSYIVFEIRIVDTGCGIAKENIDKLFMNFGKLEEHNKMNQRGTGLGLSICKSLIELMGGSVRVESNLGIGTTFIM